MHVADGLQFCVYLFREQGGNRRIVVTVQGELRLYARAVGSISRASRISVNSGR